MSIAYCQTCKEHNRKNEAIWAMQFVGFDKPTFSTLGSHYRGFKVIKICDKCLGKLSRKSLDGYEQIIREAT